MHVGEVSEVCNWIQFGRNCKDYKYKYLNPIAWGGGERAFGPHHHTGSQNSRTLSLRVSKISDFFFMLLGHIVAKFQVN